MYVFVFILCMSSHGCVTEGMATGSEHIHHSRCLERHMGLVLVDFWLFNKKGKIFINVRLEWCNNKFWRKRGRKSIKILDRSIFWKFLDLYCF